MTLNDFFRILHRRTGNILFYMILSLALSIVYLLLAPPIYKAECKLLVVDANKNNNDFSQSDMVLSVLGKSDPIATQIEVMKTRPLYEEVIQRCSLIVNNDTIFTSEELASHMSISVIRNSNVLSFTFLDTDPVRAAKITNTFVEAAEELNKKLNREEVRNMRIFVEKQLENQRKRLENLEQASVNFKQREKAVAIDLQIRSQIDATADLKSEIIKLEGERQGVLAQKQQIESFLNDSRAQADPFYALRLRKLEEINSRRSSIDAQIRSLNDQLEGINSRLSDRPQEEVSLTRFLRDEKIAEEVYTNLLSKLQELELQEAVSPTSMKIIESAAIPEFPLFPQKKITVVLALLFGFFLGSGIVFLQVFLKDTPYSVNAIKSVLPYQFLGVIPEAAQNEEVFFKSSLSSVNTESIRQIHTNLTFKEIYKSDHFNLMVTSAVSGEGKSVTCANLIYPVAETGRRAVLVNLNLRRLVFKDYFRITNKPGITDFLSGNAEFHDIVSCQTENGLEFDIIETGKNVSSPTRSYLFGRCDEFFAQLKRNYNICLFYGAPILTASETLDLSRHMSGIILVADLTYSRMKSIKVLQELLSSKNIPVLGTIINRAKSIV